MNIPDIQCNVCSKHMIQCNCPDADARLRAAAVGTQAAGITAILTERLALGKGLPATCCRSGCPLAPKWFPIVTIPAVPTKPNLIKFIRGGGVKKVTAEMLNMPVCDIHKNAITFHDIITPQAWPQYREYFKKQGFHAPNAERAVITFRPIRTTPIEINS